MAFFTRNNCIRMRRLLNQRLDGELSPADRDLLETHLSNCPACAAWADRLATATSLLRAAAPIEPPSHLSARIKAALATGLADPRRVGGTRSSVRSFSPTFVRLATAGALAVLALVLVTALRDQTVPPVPVSPLSPAPVVERLAVSPPAEALPAPPAPIAPSPRVATATPATSRAITTSAPSRPVARRSAPRRVIRTPATPTPPPPPRAGEAPSGDRAEPSGASRAATATQLAMARQRISVAPTTRPVNSGSAFTNHVVGSLVADIMLTAYLDGAPPGMALTPTAAEGDF